MRRTIYKGTRKLPDSRPNPSDPRTLSCLNSGEPVPNMTSNDTFLLNPSYSSTNLSAKQIARLGPSLTNPMNNFRRRNDQLYFLSLLSTMFRQASSDPIFRSCFVRETLPLQVELMPSSTLLPFPRLGPSLKVLHRLLGIPQVRTWYPCCFLHMVSLPLHQILRVSRP